MTAGCSTAEVIMCFPAFPFRYAIPLIARLSLSVPELVNTISSGWHPKNAAIPCRASSTAFRTPRPAQWMLDGFPNISERNGAIAPFTSGWTGVVAL
jgi:hypothetical protein